MGNESAVFIYYEQIFVLYKKWERGNRIGAHPPTHLFRKKVVSFFPKQIGGKLDVL